MSDSIADGNFVKCNSFPGVTRVLVIHWPGWSKVAGLDVGAEEGGPGLAQTDIHCPLFFFQHLDLPHPIFFYLSRTGVRLKRWKCALTVGVGGFTGDIRRIF